MAGFILGLILFVGVNITFIILGIRYKKVKKLWDSGESGLSYEPDKIPGWTKFLRIGVSIAGVLFIIFSLVYFQDPGESVVLRNFTGTISGVTSQPGAHMKSPLDSCISYDTRNNTVKLYGSKDKTPFEVSGGTVNGPQVTFQDKEGVSGNLDLVVRYSLAPDKVGDLYKEYQTQENFAEKTVLQDVRSVARMIPSRYGTLEFFQSRAEAEKAIFDALKARWDGQAIELEAVNLQEIRYSKDVNDRYDEAQKARVAIDQAEAEQEAAKINAETKKLVAETDAITANTIAKGQADANATLDESLTDKILRQRYIDALAKSGTIYVVPEGSTPMIGVPSAPTPATAE